VCKVGSGLSKRGLVSCEYTSALQLPRARTRDLRQVLALFHGCAGDPQEICRLSDSKVLVLANCQLVANLLHIPNSPKL